LLSLVFVRLLLLLRFNRFSRRLSFFTMAQFAQQAAFAEAQESAPGGAALKAGEVDLGTTIMAVEFDGGVVMGADSRTTTGSYIANRVTDKITFIHDRIACCRSGSAADTQAISDIVTYYTDVHALELEEKYPPVKVTAALFKDLCYDNKAMMMAGIICAGWDEQHGGQVYSIPIGGALVRQPFSIGGSGSTYIYGYCDAEFKEGMTREECEEFVASAVALAMDRDGSSGGLIRLAIIDKDGVERKMIPGNRLPKKFQG
jgi:20S proteasome subunit beta 1